MVLRRIWHCGLAAVRCLKQPKAVYASDFVFAQTTCPKEPTMLLKTLCFAIVALTGFALRPACADSVLNFDDLTFPGGNPTAYTTLPTGYQGFDWGGGRGSSSWVVSPNDATGWYGGTRQPYSHSGNNFGWNSSGTDLDLTVHGGGTFNVQSFWIRSWPSDTFSVTAHGYLAGREVFTQPFTTSDLYAQITANFTQIDRFTLTLPAPRSLLIDDIRVSVVPAPGALSTALLGIVPGLCLLMRRRRGRSAAQEPQP